MSVDGSATRRELRAGGGVFDYYSLAAAEELGLAGVSRLPCSLKVVLENVLRQHAEGRADGADIAAVAAWLATRRAEREIAFRFTRVLMPDSSGVPLLGDLAAMRDAMIRLGGDPARLNPSVPVDLIVDHSVMVDAYGAPDAASRNQALELRRNAERYAFLRWGAQAFDNLRIVPPGNGICHQVNLEYLARVVWTSDREGPEGKRRVAYPDSVLGMDSHTAMINSLGILGWGVGGLEGGAGALGESVAMLVPEVIGCRLTGKPPPGVTSTDLVLTVTQALRRHKVVDKFVEYFGPGVAELSLPDRATIANMSPENGATMGFFPVDAETVRYLRLTGRDEAQVALVEAYCRAQGLWRDPEMPPAEFTAVVEIDLSAVEPSVSGPSRPQDRVPLGQAPEAFRNFLSASKKRKKESSTSSLKDGDVVIAAITSCTNTSNPSVMIGAGLLARNAVARGLKTRSWVKTSLSPGSRVVADYLAKSGLQESLDALGFQPAGFGCMTCMGNSGPLPAPVAEAIEADGLTAVAVLSGNRNFEGRIHPAVRASFLASPPLVVAYALAGSVLTDLASEPLGEDREGKPVYLRDIWPDAAEIRRIIGEVITPALFRERYATLLEGTPEWRALRGGTGTTFPWAAGSTFIRRPPFFEEMAATPAEPADIRGARVLGMFGDMFTTDHISPIGAISKGTPAAEYLASLGIAPGDFVNYAARRLNHDVMIRGTFASVRVRNEMTPDVEGSSTVHYPDGARMPIHAAAERYRTEGVPLVVIAGAEYGAGSSRDWAAKGTRLLGVRAVIAETFERIHRSNLVGMGVLPLQFPSGVTRKTLALSGAELFDIAGIRGIAAPRSELECTITRADGRREKLRLLSRLDTARDVDYFRHGGLLHHVVRHRLTREVPA
ncbi:MAG: aconitate hydratase 1 [Betaproteobacteria bacterium RIFCSPLOWO2_12_FULL_66_14]|nr:MAG: aconitate hydratase 1 [Betaproteobacteria bacterium RIFCSPLOWO2_12_FULL_66_14]